MAPRRSRGQSISRSVPKKKKAPVDLGPDMHVKFTNVETPGAGVEFTYQGRGFELEDGKTYDLPEDVVHHLNSLSTPRYGWVMDPETQQKVSRKVGVNSRFSCVPITPERKRAPAPENDAEGAEAAT